MTRTKLRWSLIVSGVVVGCALFVLIFSLWYWAYVWLPQKESKAMREHFDIVREQWLLQQAEKEAMQTK